MRGYKKIMILLLLIPSMVKAKTILPAASPDTVDPLTEIMHIDDFYNAAHSLFSSQNESDAYFLFFYAEFDKTSSSSTLLRTAGATLSTYGTKVRLELGDRLLIQDSLYCVAIDNRDSTINVDKPEKISKHLFGLDLLSPKLYGGQIKDITIGDSIDANTNEGLRKMRFRFNNESPYIMCFLVYDTANYELRLAELHIRKEAAPPDTPYFVPSSYIQYVLYRTARTVFLRQVNQTIFATSNYVTPQPGGFQARPPYNTYSIINNTDQ